MKQNDVSYKSIKMLEAQFQIERSTKVWVPDWGVDFNLQPSEEAEALLMGSYFERIFQLQFWPTGDFNLFCLSPQVKKILVEVFSFAPDVVGCLSRYRLFPKAKAGIEDYNINKNTEFYYVGRISPQKNIEFLVLTSFYLQILYSPNVHLKLVGDFDNEYHKDILGCQFVDYKNKINKLIGSLPWAGASPAIYNGLGEYEWQKVIPANGISISATSLISEDFSMTSAQLQGLGRAMLIPEWGGLKDVRAENVRHYSVDCISNSHADLKTISKKAKEFAKNIIENKNIKTLPSIESENFIPNKKINRLYLENIININKKRWGESINNLVQNNLVSFVRSLEGQQILSECRRIFSESA